MSGGRKCNWSTDDDEYLLTWYPKLHLQELADVFNCTRTCVRSRYWWLVKKRGLQVSVRKEGRTSKLTEGIVRQIKHQLARGSQHKDLARQYGVSRTAITKINLGERWKWV